MANTNCLEGMACPKCQSEGAFDIEAKALFMEVTDEGTNFYEDVEWGDDSLCRCCACGFEGKVQDFTIKNQEEADA